MARKKILFIHRSLPHGSSRAQEALDALLMTSAFAQDLSVLFLDDGVLQLKTQQNTQALGMKNFAAAYKAFSLYDIENIYVEQASLDKRGLILEDLMISVQALSSKTTAELMATQDIVINF